MFIERLTKEQIKEFAESINSSSKGYEVSEPLILKSEIRYSIENTRCDFGCSINVALEDFEARGESTIMWLKYLYKIFGEEYKEAYLAECAKVFE